MMEKLIQQHKSNSTNSSDDRIFVFGSNLAGRHGKGAALYAKEHCGAQNGKFFGLQGKSFAIPTKDQKLVPLPLSAIQGWVMAFLVYAEHNPDLYFYVTPIGTGLAGYKKHQIVPFFDGMPYNCEFAETWYDDDFG